MRNNIYLLETKKISGKNNKGIRIILLGFIKSKINQIETCLYQFQRLSKVLGFGSKCNRALEKLNTYNLFQKINLSAYSITYNCTCYYMDP